MRTLFLLVILIGAISGATAQPSLYFGPLFSYHVSVLSPEGGVEGGVRSGAGGVFTIPFAKASELRVHGMYRAESGEFTTYHVVQQPGEIIGTINVVEPGVRPYISSDISLRGIEVGVSYWLRIVAIDSLGTNFYLGAGVLVDRILSGEQVDNYAHADVPATDPVERTYVFNGQFGGGGFIGASMVFPIGNGRLGFDVTYAMRTPSEIDGQNIEWLNGRSIRIGAHYDFAL